jgi:hypothetical protein
MARLPKSGIMVFGAIVKKPQVRANRKTLLFVFREGERSTIATGS